ncbi:MAG: hydrogenase nickel incorporation protein HypB [Magnetococcales bacterium]|nr:hydrogenase nickel incorporation protein HypB [Magnetococcales bacterium]
MCDTCGCGVSSQAVRRDGEVVKEVSKRQVAVLEGLLAANDHQAQHNREHFASHGVVAVNLMSSPGSGKTTLLEATLDALSGECRMGVVAGDLETDNDARRLRRHGVQAVQINTGNACHLDAELLHHALHEVPLQGLDLLFIENVGNLVCPAAYDLGQQVNVVLLSVVEGDDKPAKYPVMFRAADRVLLTKSDLLPYAAGFDPARAEASVRRLANPAPVITLSALSGEGMGAWLDWLRHLLKQRPGV